MKYSKVSIGRFLERPNRFIARVDLDGDMQVCHVKNTGRCRELLIPGAQVALAKAENPARKTAYDLIAAYKGRWINMDSQAPNQVFAEWARKAGFPPGLTELRPDFAVVLRDGKETRVDPEEVSEGDILVVRPGERIAVDIA